MTALTIVCIVVLGCVAAWDFYHAWLNWRWQDLEVKRMQQIMDIGDSLSPQRVSEWREREAS